MGWNPLSGILGGGGSKPKATTPAPTPAPTPAATSSADDVAREEQRRRMLARGLTPLAATSAMGDMTAANLGRKALLGL